MKAWMSGNVAGTGTFRCTDCDHPVSLDAADELPVCPNCGGTEFVRASLFTTAQTTIVDLTPESDDQAWIDEAREGLTDPGQYLAYRNDEDDIVAYSLQGNGPESAGAWPQTSALTIPQSLVVTP